MCVKKRPDSPFSRLVTACREIKKETNHLINYHFWLCSRVCKGAGHCDSSGWIQQYLPLVQYHRFPDQFHREN